MHCVRGFQLKMKFNILIFIILPIAIAVSLFFIFRTSRTTELGIFTFEELCRKNGDQWMEMKSMKNGKEIEGKMCYGCMIADNHFCIIEEYVYYVKNLPTIVR